MVVRVLQRVGYLARDEERVGDRELAVDAVATGERGGTMFTERGHGIAPPVPRSRRSSAGRF